MVSTHPTSRRVSHKKHASKKTRLNACRRSIHKTKTPGREKKTQTNPKAKQKKDKSVCKTSVFLPTHHTMNLRHTGFPGCFSLPHRCKLQTALYPGGIGTNQWGSRRGGGNRMKHYDHSSPASKITFNPVHTHTCILPGIFSVCLRVK